MHIRKGTPTVSIIAGGHDHVLPITRLGECRDSGECFYRQDDLGAPNAIALILGDSRQTLGMERLLNLLGRALSIAGANGAGEIARRHQNDNDVGVPAIGRLDQIEMIDPSANVFDDRRNVGSPSARKN
jgi:hypothetical protein